MPLITFQPSGKSIEVPSGADLLEAARRAGVDIDAPCGGKGTCGKCGVSIISGFAKSLHDKNLSENAGLVLACATKIGNTPLVVEVPKQGEYSGGKFAEEGVDDFNAFADISPLSPQDAPTQKMCVTVKAASVEDWAPDVECLKAALKGHVGDYEIIVPLSALRKLPHAIRAHGGIVTVCISKEDKKNRVIDVEPGDHSARDFGVAVDLGTTTIALHLVDLSRPAIIATITDYNSQISCGLDVISRINYARRHGGKEELRTRALETINGLLQKVMQNHSVRSNEIVSAAISGNTTMAHLLLGLDPENIRLEPYTPALLDAATFRAADLGIAINPEASVYLSPAVGSYVGGDITAGILCTDLAKDGGEVSLFLDIGTNGELVAGNGEFLMGCACSAGPAFEGGGIEFGMRAAKGAIERVTIDAKTGRASYETVGKTKPKGICGSGMISLIAELYTKGIIDPAGKINADKAPDFTVVSGRKVSFRVVQESESEQGFALTVSEADINNIIRAKAAIYSACSMMLSHCDMDFSDLSRIYIAGGFGRFLDVDKAVMIGLLPDVSRDKFVYIGNSSLRGSFRTLVSLSQRAVQRELARKMTYIDLSADPAYMEHYTAALFLPHTDGRRFPTVTLL